MIDNATMTLKRLHVRCWKTDEVVDEGGVAVDWDWDGGSALAGS